MTDRHSTALSAAVLGTRSVPHRVHAYLEAIVQMGATGERRLASVILFGSAATGGFSGAVSDVDLILVLPDGASTQDRHRLRDDVAGLEILHGIRKEPVRRPGPLEVLFDRLTANVRSFFVCTRGDLLSGEVARILDISSFQAAFVDRVVVPSIVGSGVTVWGEDLLPQVPLAPVRRRDVFRALSGFSGQVLLCVAAFPLLPSATKYAMGALKRSVHNCFFCYHSYPASLEDEVAFFQQLGRPNHALAQLLDLRREYRPSFAFVVRCLPAMVRLHLRTALENRFPRTMLRRGESAGPAVQRPA
jgi:predicted nucleotidyltransferase